MAGVRVDTMAEVQALLFGGPAMPPFLSGGCSTVTTKGGPLVPAPAITSVNWGDLGGFLGYSLVSGRSGFFKDTCFSGLRRNITSPVGQ
jgi:hypothetical protein